MNLNHKPKTGKQVGYVPVPSTSFLRSGLVIAIYSNANIEIENNPRRLSMRYVQVGANISVSVQITS